MRCSVLLLLCSVAFAQEFEVASIKVSAPFPTSGAVRIAPRSGGLGTSDPTHYTWPSATLTGILLLAYDIKNYQLNGPDWLPRERFDIAVVIPEGATKEQVAVMWRNLLTMRFGVRIRIEKKEFQVDDLVIGPRGHKLQETADPNIAAFSVPTNGVGPMDKEGRLNGAGLVTMFRTGATGVTAMVSGKAQPMSALASALSNEVGHPVIDKTGLTGKYDFLVNFAPTDARFGGVISPPPPPGAGAAPVPSALAAADLGLDVVTAIQQQLGLRLEKGKGMLDYVVVEKAEKVPTEN